MLTPILSVPNTYNATAELLNKRLSQNGSKVLQTFKLQDALFGCEGCQCPNHGTAKCDCDMVVLLFYASELEPITLILHGYDGQTWISLTDQASQKSSERIALAIQQALGADISSHL
jgi:hypothetical protein